MERGGLRDETAAVPAGRAAAGRAAWAVVRLVVDETRTMGHAVGEETHTIVRTLRGDDGPELPTSQRKSRCRQTPRCQQGASSREPAPA